MLQRFDRLTWMNATAPKRRGPKGHFQGSREIFLNTYVAAYMTSKKGAHRGFWHGLYSTWWPLYPWKLNNDEEPPTDEPTKMTRLTSVAPGEEVLKKEVERKLTNVCLICVRLLKLALIELHFSV